MRDIPIPSDVAYREIIRAEVGSTLYGTGLPGQEDTDYMGVCIEPWEAVLGLGHFEQWMWRSQPEGARSGSGDIDITVYGLRKYLHLAVKGNPSILLLLFVPPEYQTVRTPLGDQLQKLAPLIVSRKAAGPYLGYAQAQLDRLTNKRGGKHMNRPELIEQFGYDTKYAMHALRLALQGQEIMRTGRVVVPIPPKDGDVLRAVRRGEVSYPDVVRYIESAIRDLVVCRDNSNLPEAPDLGRINEFMRLARIPSLFG